MAADELERLASTAKPSLGAREELSWERGARASRDTAV